MSAAGPQVRVFPTAGAVSSEAAALLKEWASEAVAAHGRFVIALSGGSTPEKLYRLLRNAGPSWLPYPKMDVFWSDERAVPPDDRNSNFRLAWNLWLAHIPLGEERVHRIKGEEGAATAAADYENELRSLLGDLPRFDVILLGVGSSDAHTASLFPRSRALRSRRLVEATRAPFPPRDRITLTLRVIHAARHLLVLVTGGGKADAVRRAMQKPPSSTVPASVLLRPEATWLLDEAAASALRARSAKRPSAE